MYAQQGQWERAYEVAQASGPEVLAAFASRHAYTLAGDGKSAQAAAVLANHGAQLAAAFFPTYVKISMVCFFGWSAKCVPMCPFLPQDLLASSLASRDRVAEVHCRDFLAALCQAMEVSGPPDRATASQQQSLRMAWLAVHFTVALEASREAGWVDHAASQALALLRYQPLMPMDRYASLTKCLLCVEIFFHCGLHKP